MLLILALLLTCAAVIYISCEYFVNGIEWLGRHFKIGETATGSVLAAFGTALPESAVTLAAVAFANSPAQKQIGVGAALGGPLVLATISYGVVGLVLFCCAKKLSRKTTMLETNQKRLSRDQGWFLCIFLFKIILGLIIFSGKRWLSLLFILAYIAYVRKEIKNTEYETASELEPLKLQPRQPVPSLTCILLQTMGALTVIGFASHCFVIKLEAISPLLGIPPQLAALLLSPIATELPETMNALIWVRQGKEKLALANISGAMMIQATIPSALGIYFTPWLFDAPLIVAGIITMLAVLVLYLLFNKGRVSAKTLMPVALLYAVFAAVIAFIT